jgi:hypothetical protein
LASHRSFRPFLHFRCHSGLLCLARCNQCNRCHSAKSGLKPGEVKPADIKPSSESQARVTHCDGTRSHSKHAAVHSECDERGRDARKAARAEGYFARITVACNAQKP